MGMDVYGINPFNELGEYFRANCWTWRPICVAIEESGAGDYLDDKTFELLWENSGGGPRDRMTCLNMAKRLNEWLMKQDESGNYYQPQILRDVERVSAEPNEHGGHAFVPQEEWDIVPTMPAYQAPWESLYMFIKFLRNCGDGFEVW